MAKRNVQEIIFESDQRLLAARHGLEDLKKGPARLRTGLANVIVFGRAVTFGLQHLRGVVDNFDEWYLPRQKIMREHPLMKYFHDLRNKIEKEAKPVPVGLHVNLISVRYPQDFGDPPPGTSGFFIGDENGGSGWYVGEQGGEIEKYYIDLPGEKVAVRAFMEGAPAIEGNPNPTPYDLAKIYVDELGSLLRQARERFIPSEPGKASFGRR